MANIKLGNNTLTNVNVIKCVDADNPSQTIDFKLGDVVTVQERTITANGTYTAPSGTAYSPVIVDVPSGPTPTGTINISATSLTPTTVDVTNYANANVSVGTVSVGEYQTLYATGSGSADLTGLQNVKLHNNNTQTSLQTNTLQGNAGCIDIWGGTSTESVGFYVPNGVPNNLSVYLYDDGSTDISFISSGEIVAKEPESYYSIYDSSISSDTLYLNSTISDAKMTAFFNALQYPHSYEGNIPYECLLDISTTDDYYEFSAINANSMQSGLKILALTNYNWQTEVFTVIPFYATQAYDFTSQGWGSGVQGWQNIEYQLSDTIFVEHIYTESYFTIKVKDIVALKKVAFGEGGGSATLQAKTVTYTSNGARTVTADAGYDGLSSVTVNVSIPTYNGGVT